MTSSIERVSKKGWAVDVANTKVSQVMTSGVAPVPTATGSVLGEFKVINGGSGGALSLPAGGTWSWFGFYKADSGNTVSTVSGGVAAGGTQIFSAVGSNTAYAMVWRVA